MRCFIVSGPRPKAIGFSCVMTRQTMVNRTKEKLTLSQHIFSYREMCWTSTVAFPRKTYRGFLLYLFR
jgi:hypothetical protein